MNKKFDVVSQILRNAEIAPKKIAVEDMSGCLTYEQLVQQSMNLKQKILSRYMEGATICVDLGRCKERVIALVAILAANASYLPFDSNWPQSRKEMVFQSALPQASIQVNSQTGEFDLCECSYAKGANQKCRNGYLIYTSGSTGTPKGVEISKESLNYVIGHSVARFPITCKDKLLAVSSPAFDFSMLELLAPLAAGGMVCVADEMTSKNPDSFSSVIERHGITILTGTPTLFYMMTRGGWTPNETQMIILGGEAPYSALVERLSEAKVIWNIYGPTETTIYCLSSKIVLGSPIVLGTAFPGTKITLDRSSLSNTNFKTTYSGEIIVEGPSVGRGYIGGSVTDNMHFFDNHGVSGYRTGDVGRLNQNGEIEYLGRIDNQVKIHGYRIESEEVEQIINRILQVQTSCVLPFSECPDAFLVAFLPEEGLKQSHLSVLQLRDKLKEELPSYEVPAFFQVLKSIPMNNNGKIDRGHLRSMWKRPKMLCSSKDNADGSEVNAEKENSCERVIVNTVSSLLGCEIGTDDNFFDVGVNSLRAVELIAMLRENGIRLTVPDVYKYPSAHALSLRVPNYAIGVRADGSGKDFLLDNQLLLPSQIRFIRHGIAQVKNFTEMLFYDLSNETARGLSSEVFTERMLSFFPEIGFGLRVGEDMKAYLTRLSKPIACESQVFNTSMNEQKKTIQRNIAFWASQLDVVNGPLSAILIFKCRDVTRVVILLHHWLCDAISLKIFDRELRIMLNPCKEGIANRNVNGIFEYSNFLTKYRNSVFGQRKISRMLLNRSSSELFGTCAGVAASFAGKVLPTLTLTDATIPALFEQSRNRYGLLDKIVLAAVEASIPSICKKQQDYSVALTRNGREQRESPAYGDMIGWISSTIPVFHYNRAVKSIAGAWDTVSSEYEGLLEYETAWNAFQQGMSIFKDEDRCSSVFVNVTRVEKEDLLQSDLLTFIRGVNYPYAYGYPLEVRVRFREKNCCVTVSYNSAEFNNEQINLFQRKLSEWMIAFIHYIVD